MGRGGWIELKSTPFCVRGWPATCADETAGQMDGSYTVSLPVCPGPSFLGLHFCDPENRLGVGWVGRCSPLSAESGRIETSGINWTFTSLCLGHKAAATSYAAVRQVVTEYNDPLVESSPRTGQHA